MWKKLLPIIVVLVVLAYSFLWFRHAGETETQARAFLDTLSGQQGIAITYDDISVGGFPFEFVTDIHNPVITLDSAKLLATAYQMNGIAAAEPTQATHTNKIAIQGDIKLKVNYFSRRVALEVSGTSQGENQAGEKVVHWAGKEDGVASCAIKLGPEADMSILQESAFSVLKNPATLAKNFESIDCLADPMEIVNSDSGDMLYRGGDQIFSVSLDETAPGNVSINLALTSNDFEVSDQWSQWMDEVMEAVNPGGLNTGILAIQSHEAVGKQNTEIKLSYRGPSSLDTWQENEEINFQLPVFSLSNNLYHINMPASFALTKMASQFSGEFSLDGKATYNPAIDGYANQTVAQIADTIYAQKDSDARYAIRIGDLKKEELQAGMQAMVPSLGEFKTANAQIEASFKGREDETLHQLAGEATLKQLSLRMGDYGFSATGTMMLAPQRGEISIHCYKCHETVEKLVVYLTNFQKLVSMVNPGLPAIPDGVAFRSAIAGFIENLSQPAEDEPDARIIQISDSGNGQIVISGHTMQDVMALAMQTFMPFFMPPPQPGQGSPSSR